MEGIPHEDLIAHEQAISSGGNAAKRFKAGGSSDYSALTPEQIQQQIAAHKAGGVQPAAAAPAPAVNPTSGYYPPPAAAPVGGPPSSAYPPQYSHYYQQQPQYPARPPPMGYRPPPYGPPPGYGGPPPPHQWAPPGAYPPPAGQGYPPAPHAAGMSPVSPNSPMRPPVGYDASSPVLASPAGAVVPSPYAGVPPYGPPAHTQAAYDPNAAAAHIATPTGNYEGNISPQASVPAVPQTIAPGGKQKPTKTQLIYNDSEISPVSCMERMIVRGRLNGLLTCLDLLGGVSCKSG